MRDTEQAAGLIDRLDPSEDFNFEHFRMRHMVAELLRTGLPPGSEAPDFELPSTDGPPLQLSDLRGQPVLLHFVSYTCPVTRGGVATMQELYRLYGEQVRFVEVLIRQAHPGERHGAYRSNEQKLQDARDYKREENVPWPVLIDDLACSVQRAYGGLAAAAYLIDSRGIVAFCGTWGQSPALRNALDDLLARGGTGSPSRNRHRPPTAPRRRHRRRTRRPRAWRTPSPDRPRTRIPQAGTSSCLSEEPFGRCSRHLRFAPRRSRRRSVLLFSPASSAQASHLVSARDVFSVTALRGARLPRISPHHDAGPMAAGRGARIDLSIHRPILDLIEGGDPSGI